MMKRDAKDNEALLAAIVASPDDDAPRLVYADWLQGRGDPRGELIQLQCQLAMAPDDARRKAIRASEKQLLAAHGATWNKRLYDLLPSDGATSYDFVWRRGFVERATITLACVPHLEALFAAAPLLRELRIAIGGSTIPIPRPRLRQALELPLWRQLRELELILPGGGNALAYEVAGAAQLAGLRALRLNASALGDQVGYFEPGHDSLVLDDDGLAALLAAPSLGGLSHLDLSLNRLTARGIGALAQSSLALRSLDLSYNSADEGLADALAALALRELESLRLCGIKLGAPEVAALVGNRSLVSLRELDLERCQIGAKGVTALCEVLAVPLKRLRLERNSLGDAGATAIAGCARLSRLTELEAGHNRIGQKGAAAIASSPHLANLERLTLNEPRWTEETRALFGQSPTLVGAKIYLQGRLVGRKAPRPVRR